MNIPSSNVFYQELMNSTIFNQEQKAYIKSVYEKCHNKIYNKISKSVKHSAFTGRPTKIKNKESFNLMLNYYKKGFASISTIIRIYRISKQTFFRYLREIYDENNDIKTLSPDKMKEVEQLYNKYCYDYAKIWTAKLWTDRYKDDMMQDCLTDLWSGVIEYYSSGEDERTIPFKAFCNNICEKVLHKYIQILTDEKKILNYDSYWSDDDKYNYLDKHIIRNDTY